MFKVILPLALALAVSAQNPAGPAAPVPAPVSTTPGACLKEVRDYTAKRRAEIPSASPAVQTMTPQQRALVLRQIDADRLTMAKACAAKFDVTTTADSALADLAALYTEAALPDRAADAIGRALVVKALPESDRAAVLLQAIQIGLREPKGDERNARLEGLSDQLDKLPAVAAFTQQWTAHQSLEGYYRYDDIDAGIIKHATWILDAAGTFTPDQRAKLGPSTVGAYVNMAEAWAGEGMNDKAIALLQRAEKDLRDVPNVVDYVQPELERLELVGTTGAPITAPRWLNLPAGRTTLDLKGTVTLLEFSAHWCVPCQESYPGVNRLRATYAPRGFQVVIATEMWGYFKAERPLDPATEFDRDRTYFAEHGLDVPIAVGDQVSAKLVNGKVEYSPAPNPNDAAYKVGGIPQIMLIDKQGKIRLVMVGYDDANEPKLAKMIDGLLKDK